MAKQARRFRSLRWKFGLASTAIILTVVVLMGFCTWVGISCLELDDALDANQRLAQAMGRRFDENADAVKRQIDFVTLDGTLEQKLAQWRQGGLLEKELKSLITLRSMSMEEIGGVYLYDLDGRLITKWVRTPNRPGNYELPNQMDPALYSPTGQVTAFFFEEQLVFQRAVRTLEDWQVVAYISFVYDADVLRSRLNLIAGQNAQLLALYDSETDVLITSQADSTGAFRQALAGLAPSKLENGTFLPVDGMGEYLICGTPVIRENWYLLTAVEKAQIFRAERAVLLITLVFASIGVLLSLAVMALTGRMILRPLRRITQATREVGDGRYTATLPTDTSDELGLLAVSFNEMSSQIDRLVNQKLKSDLAYQEMQLSLLQKQINPHFLYNTLECINALAQLGRTDDVRTVTVSFASLLKTQLTDQRFCTVGQEIACTENFLKIYRIMRGNSLHACITLPPDCAGLIMPSLLLQPLVENAVLHGLRSRAGTGCCSVEVSRDAQWLCLSVSDDGCGAPAEVVSAVQAYVADGNAPAGRLGIGLRNVIDRLRFVYGDAARFTLYSDPEWGTAVEIKLPLNQVYRMDDAPAGKG